MGAGVVPLEFQSDVLPYPARVGAPVGLDSPIKT